MDLFGKLLSVAAEELDLELRGHIPAPWADFILNPRRLRGSDFLMRWSQGVWSEKRIIQAVNDTQQYVGLPYGPSGTAPDNDPRAYELYFERLEKASTGKSKRPDLLIFRKAEEGFMQECVNDLGGIEELPFTREDDVRMQRLLENAIVAVECENSLWQAKLMPDYGSDLEPQKRMGGKLGMKKTAVLPTVIIKEEDREPLRIWQSGSEVPIHIWHVFYDLAFGISLDKAESLINEGRIIGTEQIFQAPGGATTRKTIYKIYYQHAYPLAIASEEPSLVADRIVDKNGHILPYVRFEGGKFRLTEDCKRYLNELSR